MTEHKKPILSGLAALRIEQAKLLKGEVVSSCVAVLCLIVYVSAILLLAGQTLNTAIWLTVTTTMALIVYLYARFKAPNGISAKNVNAYLNGHVLISTLTGAVWSGFAIFILDGSSYLSLFIAGTVACTITTGGMLPSSSYRASYVGLTTSCLLPLALYWLIVVPDPARYIGIGLLLYYGFGMVVSAKSELRTHDVIAAREAKALMRQLNEKNELIQQAYNEKNRFLAATSHDLSQPLHAQGYFIQALRTALTTPSQHKLLDKVETSWRSQGKLLQGIVDITRLDSGIIIPKPQFIELATELGYLTDEYKEAASKKAISLHCEFKPVTLKTDPVLLVRILRNLLSNAIKFTPIGGHIELITTIKNGLTEIIIRDNGLGIPTEEHEHIFAEYIQLNKSVNNAESGLGLGLSIVQRLAKLLNINLKFQSIVGKGTQFTLILPIATGEAPLIKNQAEETAQLGTSSLIVIVDDEQDIRDGMSILLTSWGCQVIAAASGLEAITLLNSTPETPNLLIVDKRLTQGESGFNIIDRLREEVNSDIPAIIMTGDLTGFKNIEQRSDIQIMPKPINPNEIKRIIESLSND